MTLQKRKNKVKKLNADIERILNMQKPKSRPTKFHLKNLLRARAKHLAIIEKEEGESCTG